MNKWVKNISGVQKTYSGRDIADGAYFEITPDLLVKFSNDATLLTDLGNGITLMAKDDSGSNDITDVNEGINYLKGIITLVDADGAPLTRTKITRAGWHYQAHSIEITTSKYTGGFYNSDITGTDLTYGSIKFYDVNGTELTNQTDIDANCVETVIFWEPTEDIEVLGGVIFQASVPTNDVRLWIMAAPDIPAANGGSVPFVQGGLNLKYMGTGQIFDIDGRTPKLMPYNFQNMPTNKFKLRITHGAGVQHSLLFVAKVFREAK